MFYQAQLSPRLYRFFSREFWYVIAYLVISVFVFSYFFRHPQNVMGDNSHYLSLSSALMDKNFDVLHFDFEMRTYVHPTYLALARMPAKFLGLSQIHSIYLFNFVLLLLANYFIYLRVRTFDRVVARAFLIVSSLNVFTLSFANTNLTENTSIFFTALLFYFLTGKDTAVKLFGAGVTAGLFMYTRPSAIVLFFVVLLLVIGRGIFQRKIKRTLFFFIGAVLPISVGMLNTYNLDQRVALFTTRTQGIYEMQVANGPQWIKYETSADRNLKYQQLFYTHPRNDKFIELQCKGTVGCILTYFKTYPVDYVLSLGHHVFNIFDRVYVYNYVTDLEGRGVLLSFINYFMLTAVFIGGLFFTYSKQWLASLGVVAVIAFGLLSIYIPTIVEPRFSAPLYPFIFMVFCYYLVQMYKSSDRALKVRILFLQISFVVMCFLLSDMVSITVINGTERVY